MRIMFLLLIFLCGCTSKIERNSMLAEQLKTKTKVEVRKEAFEKGNVGPRTGGFNRSGASSSNQFHF